MGGNGFEVYGNVGALQGLAGDQQAHMSRFKGIMGQIDAQAQQTLGQWEGAGNPEFRKLSDEYQTHFNAVLSAFAKMVDATDGAADNYQRLCNYLNGLF